MQRAFHCSVKSLYSSKVKVVRRNVAGAVELHGASLSAQSSLMCGVRGTSRRRTNEMKSSRDAFPFCGSHARDRLQSLPWIHEIVSEMRTTSLTCRAK